MKRLVYFIFFITGLNLSCSSNKDESNDNSQKQILSVVVNNLSLEDKIDTSLLKNLSPDELRLLRNEIFARKGYIFNSTDLNEYFSNFGWYTPRYNVEEIKAQLSETDQINIELIKEFESSSQTQRLDPDFEKFLSSIPYLEFPFKPSCINFSYENKPEYDKELNQKFSHESIFPYRRVGTNNFETLLFIAPADILIPIITTYKKDGKEIDSYQVLKFCGGEPGYYQKSHAEITSDLQIITIDSIWTSEVDSLYNEIEGTSKLEIKETKMTIDNTGHFIEINN